MRNKPIVAVILLMVAGFCVWFFLLRPTGGPIPVETDHYMCLNKKCGFEFEHKSASDSVAVPKITCPKCKKKTAVRVTTYCETCQKYISPLKLKTPKIRTKTGRTAIAVVCPNCKQPLSFKTKGAAKKEKKTGE